MDKLILGIIAALLIIIGILYSVFPEALLSYTGDFKLDNAAAIDVRATYGGFQLGLGCYLLQSLKRDCVASQLKLTSSLLFTVGLIRMLSFVTTMDESREWVHLVGSVFELGVASLVYFYKPSSVETT
jgi:hypothetical protein